MILQISPTGRITLTQEIMDHLGTRPGDEIELELLPGGQAVMRAVDRKTDLQKNVTDNDY